MSKRYWLFQWSVYDASGGLNDFYGDYDDLATAKGIIEAHNGKTTCAHIFDAHKGVIVSEWVERQSRAELIKTGHDVGSFSYFKESGVLPGYWRDKEAENGK